LWVSCPLTLILCIPSNLSNVCFTLSSLFIYKSLFPPRSLLLFGEDEMPQDPSINFLLPSYAKVQAWVQVSLPSPPSRIISRGYDPRLNSVTLMINHWKMFGFGLGGGLSGLWTCWVVLRLGGELYWCFMCCVKVCFYLSFHTKLLLIHLLVTPIVYVSKHIHTTMLE
jgi:hypothetical protein